MKKHALIAVALILTLAAPAQKIDTTLLYGKWSAIGMHTGDILVSKDDIVATRNTLVKIVEMQELGYTYAEKDSIIINTAMQAMFAELANCSIEFKKMGALKMHININGEVQNMEGVYKWLPNYKLFLDDTSSVNADDTVIVKQLTKNRLYIEMSSNRNNVELVFERN